MANKHISVPMYHVKQTSELKKITDPLVVLKTKAKEIERKFNNKAEDKIEINEIELCYVGILGCL